MRVLLFPCITGLLRAAELATGIADQGAGLDLADYVHNLLFRER